MERIISFLPIAALIAGGWAFVNGVLHDIFVLIPHKTGYDRELLRLLMDGHILITCGIIQMIAYKGLSVNAHWGYYLAGVATISLLIYCAMIFPFLKSIGTISLNVILMVMLIISFAKKSSIV